MKRKLTGPERALWLRGVISANIVMAAKVSGSITADELRRCWSILLEKHPLTGVHLQLEEPDIYFVSEGTAEIPVREVIADSEDCWQNEILHEMETPFDYSSNMPLVKSVLVYQDDSIYLIICGHHTVCDGLALSFLLRDMLLCLSGQEEKIQASQGIVFDNSSIPDSVTMPGWLRMAVTAANFVCGKLMPPLKNPKKVTMPGTTLLFWDIEKEQYAALRKACKKNRVAEHSAITALFLAAQYQVQGASNPIYKQVYTPVSVRNKLKKKVINDFAMYASDAVISCPHDPDKDFWDNCRKLQTRIKENITDQKVLGQILLANTVHPNLLDRIMVPRVHSTELKSGFILSNLGRLPLPRTYGALTLEGFRGPFGYIPHTEKSIAMVSFKGQTSIVMGYRTSVVSTEEMIRFKEKAVELLQKYTEEL